MRLVRDASIPLLLLLVLLLTAPIRTPAQSAPGSLELVSVTTPSDITNQIFSESSAVLSVTVSHTGDPLSYFVTVSRGGGSSFDPRRMETRYFFGLFAAYLNYNVYTPAGEIARDLTGPITESNVISGSFTETGQGYASQTGYFDVTIPPGQMVRRGTYNDELTISLYEGTPAQLQAAQLVDSENIVLTSTTSTVAQIAISGESNHTMDFGFLTEGAIATAELLFRTNAAYRIDATSENAGMMVNVNQPASDPISYQLRVDGTAVNLASPRIVRLGLFAAGSADTFDSIPLTVTIGPVESVLPGRFEDVITFTISTF